MVRPWNAPSVATTWVRPVRRVSLNGGLVRLGAGVAEEHPGAGRPGRPSSSSLGEGDLRLGGEEVGHVPERRQLAVTAVDERRVGVTERVDGDAAEQVEVAGAVLVPDVAALAARPAPAGAGRRCPSGGGVPLLELLGWSPCQTSFRAVLMVVCVPGSTLVPTPVGGEDLQQHRVRLPAVDDGGAADAAAAPRRRQARIFGTIPDWPASAAAPAAPRADLRDHDVAVRPVAVQARARR